MDNNAIQKILKKYPVVFAYIFGSHAKGKTGPMSDIDIAVFFRPKISEEKQRKLRYKIQNDIEIALSMPEKIDIVPLNNAQPLLEREVVYDGKIIYNQDDAKRAHYEAGAIGRWLDWQWYDDQYNEAIIKGFGKPIAGYKTYG